MNARAASGASAWVAPRVVWALVTVGVVVHQTGPVAAQSAPTLVGLVAGASRTDPIWRPRIETREVSGLLLGAFVDVTTPLPWLSARGEAVFTQRGGDVLGDIGGEPVMGGVRTDYLTASVQLRAALSARAVRLHASAGLVDDIVVRSRLDPMLTQVLLEEGTTVFGVVAGAGVGFWITQRLFGEVEARVVRHVANAYSGDLISVRNSSREVVARLAIPIRR